MPTLSPDNTYYVDLTTGDPGDPDFTPGSFISAYPEGLAADHMVRGVGNCSFQLSFSALDQDGHIVVSSRDFIGPYRSYWRLRYGDQIITSGPIVSTNSKRGSDFMSVFGKTWEHFLERWQYPFDPRPGHLGDYSFAKTYQGNELTASGFATPTGVAYQAHNRDVIYILSDVLSQTMNIVPHRIPIFLSNLTTPAGITTNYQLSWGDTSYMDSLVNQMSVVGNGFDWGVGIDRQFYWASPYRFGTTDSPVYYDFIYDGRDGVLDIDFTNNGPAATHLLGTGSGLAVQTQLGRAFGETTNQIRFSRLDRDQNFGDIRNAAQLIAMTQKQFSEDLQPQHVISVTVDPIAFDSYFWLNIRAGRAIFIYSDLTYHLIDSGFQVLRWDLKTDLQGNDSVDFELKQIYATTATPGTAEG